MLGVILVTGLCIVSNGGRTEMVADSTITVIGYCAESFDIDETTQDVDVQARGRVNDKLRRQLDERVLDIKVRMMSIGGPAVEVFAGEARPLQVRGRHKQKTVGLHLPVRLVIREPSRLGEILRSVREVPGAIPGSRRDALHDDTLRDIHMIACATADARRQAQALADESGIVLGEPRIVIINPPRREISESLYMRDLSRQALYPPMTLASRFDTDKVPQMIRMAAVKIIYSLR
jgi:hypothetical protein